MKPELQLFHRGIFFRTLSVIAGMGIVAGAIAMRLYDGLAPRDVAGACISALLLSYLVHLWIGLYLADRNSDRGMGNGL